ncbi:hypothetical protein [Butyrivibrio sp. INlla14]|uniref:hypothetical protein n=1 Tax=Butyrivibrio sp. INlla14 TaxID=1520808 RepID=UPI000876666B|nr:hypothetical protein [Butyrivibrio sp. INlla14]SCY61838.1 hypothetical protein SAMN02910371_03041 [Butyrivibrio sp. INlla14]
MKNKTPKVIIDIDLATGSPIAEYAEYLWNRYLSEDNDPYSEQYFDEKNLPPEYSETEPDPYFKLPGKHKDTKRNIRFDEEGSLHVKNISAWWIPHLSITREIGGTVYSVTGSYDGEEDFLRKLERISFKKHDETEVNLNDTDDSK